MPHLAHSNGTVNCNSEPLIYPEEYPAHTGHDYGVIVKRNFNKVVLETNGKPVVMDRQVALEMLNLDRKVPNPPRINKEVAQRRFSSFANL